MSEYQDAIEHLRHHDPILAIVIQENPQYTPRPHADYYTQLVSSIIGQQLSVKAARSIKNKFVAHFDDVFPSPEQILNTDIETLRSLGLSRPKAGYIQDLAQHILDGRLHIESLPELSNEEIMRELVAVKGIGEWTAHMYLIFALGRLDVLPVGDLGIRMAAQNLYGLESLPRPKELVAIAEQNKWHPYESVASWYLWRSLDNEPK